VKEALVAFVVIMVVVLVTAALSWKGSDSPGKCMESVQKAFPEGDWKNVPIQYYKFIVRDKDGSVWWVETFNFTDSEISSKVKLFNGNLPAGR
jgi:hypothetical protein